VEDQELRYHQAHQLAKLQRTPSGRVIYGNVTYLLMPGDELAFRDRFGRTFLSYRETDYLVRLDAYARAAWVHPLASPARRTR
jgi:hypothetical protein